MRERCVSLEVAIPILTVTWLALAADPPDNGFMGASRLFTIVASGVCIGLAAGCLPPPAQQPQPAPPPVGYAPQPTAQSYPQQSYPQQPYPQQPYPAQGQTQPAPAPAPQPGQPAQPGQPGQPAQPGQPGQPAQPAAAAQAGATVAPAAPTGPTQPAQMQPQTAQAQPAQPAPYPPPAPYGQPSQPYPPPAPYGQPYGYSTSSNEYITQQGSHSHFHDGEVMADFAAVGVLAATDLAVRQDISNGNAVTLLILGGLAGGGGVGYLLTQKYPIDSGSAHATTIGLMLGIANGALLVEPTDYHDASSIMGLLTLGSVAGATGGFIYGQHADLTSGQSMFVGNLMLLGSSTALLTAVTANRDGTYGSFENTTLAIGLDGGAVAGALIAPHLDWSPRRAKYVFASTFVGALVGGLLAGAIAKPRNGSTSDTNASLVTGAMTAGLWGGFGLGILMTKDSGVDPRYMAPASAGSATASATSFAPFIGDKGQLGVMTGGTF